MNLSTTKNLLQPCCFLIIQEEFISVKDTIFAFQFHESIEG